MNQDDWQPGKGESLDEELEKRIEEEEVFCAMECICGQTVYTNGDVDCDDEEGCIEHECDGEPDEDDLG